MAHTSPAPAFAQVSKALFGDAVDPRELWDEIAKLDSSQVHVNGDAAPPKKHQLAGHKKTGGLLLLGTAAEADAATHATTDAVKAVRTAGSTGMKAAKIGRAGLQVGNMGIGLVAAHELMKKPKPVSKGLLTSGAKVMPKPLVGVTRINRMKMTPANIATLHSAGDRGARLVLGATAAGVAASAGVAGSRHGARKARAQMAAQQQETVEKAFRVKPLNPGNVARVPSLKARRVPGVITKAAPALGWTGTISKVDQDKRQVFGWCSLSTMDGKPVVDLQGDYVPLDEIEKSAYTYVIESRKGGDMHRRVRKFDVGDEPLHTADLIESFVVTPEKLRGMGLAEDALPHGWWVGFKVNDETQWQMVKNGERAGFSIHGTGKRAAA